MRSESHAFTHASRSAAYGDGDYDRFLGKLSRVFAAARARLRGVPGKIPPRVNANGYHFSFSRRDSTWQGHLLRLSRGFIWGLRGERGDEGFWENEPSIENHPDAFTD